MKLQELLADPNEIEAYAPPHHADTTNWRLWPLQQSGSADANIEVIKAHLGPNGDANAHFHAHSDQMVYILDGRMGIDGPNDSVELTSGQFIFLPMNFPHRIRILSPDGVDCLVMYMPMLAPDDIIKTREEETETTT